jgi:hypothetical protein
VSGAQKWNGTEDTLNANPATTNRIPATAMPGGAFPRAAAISVSLSEPVIP